jgi:hypothetical protein
VCGSKPTSFLVYNRTSVFLFVVFTFLHKFYKFCTKYF